MASEAKKIRRPRVPLWRIRFTMMHRLLLIDVFPDKDGYHASRWAMWEGRIRQGHDAEEKHIERAYKARSKQQFADPDDAAEIAGEDYMETCRLTSTMYAALVVGIWSEMEHFLKDIVRLCYQALDTRRRTLGRVQRFCEDSLAGKQSKVPLKQCIKALKELAFGVPFAFDEIQNALKHQVDIQLERCAEYLTIDGIRILNNSFKHSRGRYEPEKGKPYTQISKSLLAKWSILDDRNEIDYSKLPIKELVVACNCFCQDLLGKVEHALKERADRGAGHGA